MVMLPYFPLIQRNELLLLLTYYYPLYLKEYPLFRAQGALPRTVIDAIAERLLDLPVAERRAVQGMVAQRADVLPAGAIILSEALGRLGVAAAPVERNDLLLGYLVRTGSASSANG